MAVPHHHRALGGALPLPQGRADTQGPAVSLDGRAEGRGARGRGNCAQGAWCGVGDSPAGKGPESAWGGGASEPEWGLGLS